MYLYLLIFVCGSFNYLFVAADNDDGNILPNVPFNPEDCLKCVNNGSFFCPNDNACTSPDLVNCTVPFINTTDACLQLTSVSTSSPTPSTLPTTVSSANPTDPTTSTTPVPSKTTVAPNGRHFDPPSFIGGIVLALGLLAIIYVSFKFYKARTERNYHIL